MLSAVEIADVVAECFAEDITLPSNVATYTIEELTTFLESGGVTIPAGKPSSSEVPSEEEEEEEDVRATGAASPEPPSPEPQDEPTLSVIEEAATPAKFPDPPAVKSVEEKSPDKPILGFLGKVFGFGRKA